MTTHPEPYVVLRVDTKDSSDLARAAEVLSRAAAGLALEGIFCHMSFSLVDVDDEEEADA